MISVDAGEYAQERRLARAIEPDDANLRAIEIGKIDVFEDGLLVIELTDADHGIDDFVFSGHGLSPQITEISQISSSLRSRRQHKAWGVSPRIAAQERSKARGTGDSRCAKSFARFAGSVSHWFL